MKRSKIEFQTIVGWFDLYRHANCKYKKNDSLQASFHAWTTHYEQRLLHSRYFLVLETYHDQEADHDYAVRHKNFDCWVQGNFQAIEYSVRFELSIWWIFLGFINLIEK